MADRDTEFLLRSLTAATRDLCAVLKNGLNTGVIKVQEGFEDMIEGPMGAVTMITDQLPGGPARTWTGEIHESEVKVEWVETMGDERHETPATGVRLTHLPTGIIREAMSSGDRDRNKEIAWRSLEGAVEKRYREMNV